MPTLKEINFSLKVTRVHRRSIDRIAKLIEEETESVRENLLQSLDDPTGIDAPAWHDMMYAPEMLFNFYAIAIVHCYSLLENNRKLICLEIPNLTTKQKKNLHDIRVVKQCLSRIGVTHDMVRCYKTMDEFRLVNNAVKHHRMGLDTQIICENRSYSMRRLRALYRKADYLGRYLTDLYTHVLGKSPIVPKLIKTG